MRCLMLLMIWAGSVLAAELTPLSWDWSRAHESVIALSRFLDAPAGKRGFVRVQDGHFAQPDGRHLRVWGMNIALTAVLEVMSIPQASPRSDSRLHSSARHGGS